MADVTVITATIGHPGLTRALRSVQLQTEPVNHWVVVDGSEFEADVRPDVEAAWAGARGTKLVVLPDRTGGDGWCSHRIYAAVPFLVNTAYVCFLDQDNWFAADHLTALLDAARTAQSRAAYSLRSVHSAAGTFICRDECQSLGPLHDSYDTPGHQHIDTNCWLLSRELAVALAPFWHQPRVGDRRFARNVMDVCPGLSCSGLYSLHYTVASRAESVTADYFLRGNRAMHDRYPRGLPWERPAPTGQTVA